MTEKKTPDRTQYHDLLGEDVLEWDSQPTGRKDRLIIEHEQRGLELLLFYRKEKYEFPGAGFRYEGPFEYQSHAGQGPAHFRLKRASSGSRPPKACWAILCNPATYDIEAAVEVLDEDTWNLPKGDAHPGDRLVLWKAKGRGQHRGVVALGEVTAAADVIASQPGSADFWVSEPQLEPKRRIRLRYIVPPKAPLWLEDDTDGVLGGLSVANAQGNKLYKVTEEQWVRLVEALGGEDNGLQTALADAALDAHEEADAIRRGQGFSSSPERRKAVELHAMKAATAYFAGLGYDVQDTSATRPYDLVGRLGGERIFIEVKGTSARGERVFLTKNEVAHAQAHPDECVLFILYDIAVDEPTPGRPKARGGVEKVIWPWAPADDDLLALSFQYTVPSSGWA